MLSCLSLSNARAWCADIAKLYTDDEGDVGEGEGEAGPVDEHEAKDPGADVELGEDDAVRDTEGAATRRSQSHGFALSEAHELMALTQARDQLDGSEKLFILVMRWVCALDILVFGMISSYYTFTAATTERSWSLQRNKDNDPTYGVALRDGCVGL